MGDWTNGSISRWTQCIWESWFEKIAKEAEKGLSLDDNGKVETLKQIKNLATKYAKEIANYR